MTVACAIPRTSATFARKPPKRAHASASSSSVAFDRSRPRSSRRRTLRSRSHRRTARSDCASCALTLSPWMRYCATGSRSRVDLVRGGDVRGEPPVAAPSPRRRRRDRLRQLGAQRDRGGRRLVLGQQPAERTADDRQLAVPVVLRRARAAAGAVDHLHVAVHEADLGPALQQLDLTRELVRQPHVVGVEQRDVAAASPRDRAVRRDGRTLVLLIQHGDRIAERGEDRRRLVRRTVVDDDHLQRVGAARQPLLLQGGAHRRLHVRRRSRTHRSRR